MDIDEVMIGLQRCGNRDISPGMCLACPYESNEPDERCTINLTHDAYKCLTEILKQTQDYIGFVNTLSKHHILP